MSRYNLTLKEMVIRGGMRKGNDIEFNTLYATFVPNSTKTYTQL